MSTVGKPAPQFRLEGYVNGDFATFDLADYRGKWVALLFYPLDFTFVCPTEVLAFSKAAEQFKKLNVQLFGISVDSKFTHKAWVDSAARDGGLGGTLSYPLLADLTKSVSNDYGVLLPDGVALRGLFLVNPEGVVVHETVNFLPVGRSVDEFLRTVKAFQFVAAHDGEVCPADWEEGKETMTATTRGLHEYLEKNA